MLGGYETCFGISLDPQTSPWKQKRSKIVKIKPSVARIIRAKYKVEVEIFLIKSKFLGFVEAPVVVFYLSIMNDY